MSRTDDFIALTHSTIAEQGPQNEAWVEWVASRADGDFATVLYRWITHVADTFETHPIDGRRWELPAYEQKVFGRVVSVHKLAAEAASEILEPEGPGVQLRVSWADGLVDSPHAIQWHGEALEWA